MPAIRLEAALKQFSLNASLPKTPPVWLLIRPVPAATRIAILPAVLLFGWLESAQAQNLLDIKTPHSASYSQADSIAESPPETVPQGSPQQVLLDLTLIELDFAKLTRLCQDQEQMAKLSSATSKQLIAALQAAGVTKHLLNEHALCVTLGHSARGRVGGSLPVANRPPLEYGLTARATVHFTTNNDLDLRLSFEESSLRRSTTYQAWFRKQESEQVVTEYSAQTHSRIQPGHCYILPAGEQQALTLSQALSHYADTDEPARIRWLLIQAEHLAGSDQPPPSSATP